MEDHNPYASAALTPAAFAAASERATFLKRVYSYLFLGILGFAATLWAAGNVPPVTRLMVSLWELIAGNGLVGWAIYMGLFLGGSFAVQALAEKKPINVVAYASWAFLLGLLVAPLTITAPAGTVATASLLTAVVFGALTVFVFITGKDFQWLRGLLFVGFLTILGTIIAGAIFGFSLGIWISGAIVLLYSGYILYHTSEILHRLPTSMPMSGAIMLFTDVVLLFKHILILLMSRD